MRARGAARLVLAAAVVLGGASLASAQTSIFGLKVEGEVELSGRIYADRPAPQERAKLEEYRDLSEQPFGSFRLRLATPDDGYVSELGGDLIGQEDQEFFLSTGRTGKWRFDFDWNQIPHLLYTNTRFLATEPSPGVLVLPTPRPPLAAHNAAPTRDVGFRSDVAHLEFSLFPNPDWDLKVEYTRIKKDGDRPMGMAFGSPGGNFYEILKPIDHTIHDARIRGTWAGSWWQAQAGYTLSLFTNKLDSVTADNPCFGNATCGTDANGAPSRGRTSLEPDNIAHTVFVAGAVNLPMRSRVAATVSYSLRLQDDDFLPHTINPALSSSALTLPRNSLDGQVGIFVLDVNGSTRPLPPLTLRARYRLFDFNDMRDELVFPGHVVNDRAPVVTEDRLAGEWSYTRHNADLDGRWRFGPAAAATLGVNWERWDRNRHREVPSTDEYGFKGVVDATPFDWLLARLSYRPSFRRISDYNTFAHLEHTVIEDVTPDERAQGQSVLLRKYDEADRDRQRIDLLLQFMPTDVVTVSPTFSYRNDDYYNSALGLQNAEAWTAGIDGSWSPFEWLAVSAGYTYEKIDQKQRSRNREVSGTSVIDPPDFDWISSSVDTIHTVYAGVRATLIPKVLDWVANVAYSHATGETNTSNPVTPTSGNASQRSNATAKPMPDFKDSLLHFDTGFRYFFLKNWVARLGYMYEKWIGDDFRTDTLNPFMPGTTSIFQGNDLKDYTAHIFVLSLAYRFW
jgi:MtrB/PioB family decaheme-associated outer membrane protein